MCRIGRRSLFLLRQTELGAGFPPKRVGFRNKLRFRKLIDEAILLVDGRLVAFGLATFDTLLC